MKKIPQNCRDPGLGFLQHDVKPKHEVMGSALHIPLPHGLKSKTAITVAVFYKTTKDCTALQWLEKEYVIFIVRPFAADSRD